MIKEENHCYSIINIDQASGKKSMWKIPIEKTEEDFLTVTDFLKEINCFLRKNTKSSFENIQLRGSFYENDLNFTKPISFYLDCLPFYTTSYCVNKEIVIGIHDFKQELLLNVLIAPNKTIFDLKKEIYKVTGINPTNQKIYQFENENYPQENTQTLKSLGMTYGQKMYLLTLPKTFLIRLSSNQKVLKICNIYSDM